MYFTTFVSIMDTRQLLFNCQCKGYVYNRYECLKRMCLLHAHTYRNSKILHVCVCGEKGGGSVCSSSDRSTIFSTFCGI